MIKPIVYTPFENRVPDTQYETLLQKIMDEGKEKRPIHADLPENAKKGGSVVREFTGKACCLEYKLENGFPILTCRDTRDLVQGAIGEIAAFINGVRTLDELKAYGCPEQFWKNWVTADKCATWGLEEGDLGPGSYGPALRAFPVGDGKTFDQLAGLDEMMRTVPMSRTIMMGTWIPHLDLGSEAQGFRRKVVVAPCHGTVFHVHIFPELGEMEVTCVQRSADVPVGLQFNISQWCSLGVVLAMIHGLKFTKYTHFVSSAQIYDIQYPAVEKLLEGEPRRFPTVTLEPELPYTLPWQLRMNHFKIGDDYDPHPNFFIRTMI